MRVLITGYSPQTLTSYGTIIRDLFSRIAKTGEIELAQHAWFHYPALGAVDWPLFPTNVTMDGNRVGFKHEDRYGAESFESVLQKFKPDIVWNLSDMYMSRYLDKYRKRYGFKLIRWTLTEGIPIDKDNIPTLMSADKVVAISRFAADQWEAVTGEQFETLYHGVNTDIFYPVTSDKKREMRALLTDGQVSPDDFLMTFIGVNQARKRPWLPFQILAYLRSGAWGMDDDGRPLLCEWDVVGKKFYKTNKIKQWSEPVPAIMWCHSIDDGSRWRYRALEDEWHIKGAVKYTHGLTKSTGPSTKTMSDIYRISDAIHMVSGSEGFGMPTIEAAACGVPTVYTSYGALREIGDICKGRPVGWIGWEPAPVTHVRWVYPDVASAVAEYYHIWKNRDIFDGESYKMSLHEIAKQNFGADKVAVRWLEIFHEVYDKQTVKTVGEEI